MILSSFLMNLCTHQRHSVSLQYPLDISNYATSIWFDYLTNLKGTQSVD